VRREERSRSGERGREEKRRRRRRREMERRGNGVVQTWSGSMDLITKTRDFLLKRIDLRGKRKKSEMRERERD